MTLQDAYKLVRDFLPYSFISLEKRNHRYEARCFNIVGDSYIGIGYTKIGALVDLSEVIRLRYIEGKDIE